MSRNHRADLYQLGFEIALFSKGRARHFRRRLAMAGQAVRAVRCVGQRTPMNRERAAHPTKW